ncbi:MAG: Ku protein [Microthrixaceae bacterium]
MARIDRLRPGERGGSCLRRHTGPEGPLPPDRPQQRIAGSVTTRSPSSPARRWTRPTSPSATRSTPAVTSPSTPKRSRHSGRVPPRTVEISDFVDLASIDPIHYEKTYWLAPADETAQKPYALLATAMQDEQRVGIGMVVMRTKQYLAAIRPLQGVLAMSTMRFADEVVPASEIVDLDALIEPGEREVELARQIITGLAADWDPELYHDSFTAELRSLIAEKAAGHQLIEEPSGESDQPGELVDLMAALQASVDAAKRPREDVEDRSA